MDEIFNSEQRDDNQENKKLNISEIDMANFKTKKNKEKFKLDQLNMEGQFGTVSEPRKSLSTFFRNQNKFEVSGVAILDRKASILIKICTTIISAVIVFNQHIQDNVVGGNLISIILLVGLSISLVLAIIAIKPSTNGLRKIIKEQIEPLHPHLEENLFYVWNHENYEEYEKAMEKFIKSQDLHIGNQIRANFILGRKNVITAKYLDYSFNAFLLSFVFIGIVFLFARY